MSLKDLKIGTRLGLGFAVMLLLMAFIAATGVLRLTNVGHATDEMVEQALVKERLANEWLSNLKSNTVANFAMIKTTDPAVADYFSKLQAAGSARISPAQKKLESMLDTPEEKALYAKVAASRAVVLETVGVLNKLKDSGQLAEANTLVDTKFTDALGVYGGAVEALAQHQREKIDAAARGIAADYVAGRTTLVVLASIAVLLGALFAWRLSLGIVRPLGHAVEVAQTVAAGDLSADIRVESRDEAGQLMQALKNMNESLAKVVGEVRTGTDTIATASSQIASGNQDLSSRTEEQASSLEQTAASMEELTSTVKQNADNARQANQLAVSASEVAVKGAERSRGSSTCR